MNAKLLLKKLFLIVIGSAISAYGTTKAIHAGFGSATLSIFWQGVSKTLHITIGQASFIIAVAMIITAFFLDKKQIHIGTILYQFLYSPMVDFFSPLQHYTDSAFLNFGLMCIGVILMAIGSGIYASANFGKGSYDALNFAISSRFGVQIRTGRIALDLFMAISGFLLGGQVGLCMVMTVLFSGPIVQKTVEVIQGKMPELKNL